MVTGRIHNNSQGHTSEYTHAKKSHAIFSLYILFFYLC